MTNFQPGHPAADEFAGHFGNYIGLVPEDDILDVLQSQAGEVEALLGGIGDERSRHRYGEGKWSIREVIGHITDGERVFAYRATAFARGESQPLPSFEENAYVESSSFDAVPLRNLLDAFADQRRATISMFRTLPAEAWTRKGTASGKAVSVRALAYIMAGHVRHHLRILRERYLS
jgi:hypothetical protein